MSEKMARNFILGLSKRLNKEEFASLVGYFSITQGKGKNEIPDLSLFPQLASEKEEARLKNRVKAELNYLGVSTKRFNQGTSILNKLENIKEENLNSDLLYYIKNVDPYKRWSYLKGDDQFKLTFSYNNKGCFSSTTNNKDEYGQRSHLQDRSINIDLLSLAKITQAIHMELDIPDKRIKESLETVVHTVILHEKEHLFQEKLDDAIIHLRKLKQNNKDICINLSSASNFAKFYLGFEYSAWEVASKKDINIYRNKIIDEALCNMSITTYIIGWLTEVYFNNTLTLPHENTTFKIDPNAPTHF